MPRVLVLHYVLILEVKKHFNLQDSVIKIYLIKWQILHCILFLTLVKL